MNLPVYQNYKVIIDGLKYSDTCATFREKVEETYGFSKNSYIMSWVFDNTMIKMFNQK